MTSVPDSAFIDDVPRRRSSQPAPLDVWRRTLLLGLTVAAGMAAWFVFGHTPMPSRADSASFGELLVAFDNERRAVAEKGERPISIMLLGTSRMRNVALDPAAMATAAKAAGIDRPVVTTTLGINWGGFERFAPLLPMIERRHPDVIVVMPELLTQDFTTTMRLEMGLAWLQSLMWGQVYRPFSADEATLKVCNGFADSPAARDERDRKYVKDLPLGRGPRLARAFLQRMGREGAQVLVVDVPVSKELAAIRPPLPPNWPAPAILGLPDADIRGVNLATRIEKSAYCDHAHIDPKHGNVWRRLFFREIAERLNALGK